MSCYDMLCCAVLWCGVLCYDMTYYTTAHTILCDAHSRLYTYYTILYATILHYTILRDVKCTT